MNSEALIGLQDIEPRGFQGRIVVVIEIVETDDLIAPLEQQLCRVIADKTGGAGHEQLHSVRHTVLPDDALSSSARMCSWAAASSSVACTTTIRMPLVADGRLARAGAHGVGLGAQRQAPLPARHRQVHFGEDARVEQRAVILAMRIVD